MRNIENGDLVFDQLILDKRDKFEQYQDDNSLDSIYSVEAAIYEVVSKPNQLRTIIDNVIDNRIHGSAGSFHQLINLCMLCKDYEEAYKLCKYALSRLKTSLLLYTDIIEVGSKFENQIRKCGSYIRIVLSSDKRHWDLRLFMAVFEYFYILIANSLINGINDEFYERAIEIAEGMQTFFYGKEEGYYAEAKLMVLIGKRDDARLLLEDLIQNPYDPEKDSYRDLRCPMCCKLWVLEFKDYSGNKQKVNYVVNKGLIDSERKEDIVFFLQQKEYLDQQYPHSVESDEYDSLLENNVPNYSIDTNDKTNYL